MLDKKLIPHTSAPWQQDILRTFLDDIPLESAPKILDAGCGIGNNLVTLQEKSFDITAFDIKEEPLQYAKQRYPEVVFMQSDLEKIALADDSFDIVVCTEAMEHCHFPEKVVAELYRVAKPGGYVILSTQNHCNFSAIVKFFYELFTKKNWDAWGTHNHDTGYESYITSFKLYKLCKRQNFEICQIKGADYYNAWLSWLPWFYQNYKFVDNHPTLFLGKLPFVKFFGMDFFLLMRKKEND